MLNDLQVVLIDEAHMATESLYIVGNGFADGNRYALNATPTGEVVASPATSDRHTFDPLMRLKWGDAKHIFEKMAAALIAKGYAQKPVAEDLTALKAHINSLENEVQRLHTIIARSVITGDNFLNAARGVTK